MLKEKQMWLRIGAAVSYIAMVAVNGLANGLPLNNRTTGQISDAYANLFAPAGFTFSIWGLIYALLAAYVIFQFIPKKYSRLESELFSKINPYFIISSVLNLAWIFAWHYDYIGLSLILMLGLLVTLMKLGMMLAKEKLAPRDNFIQRLPFSVYWGWITVATIANVSVFLVSLNWNSFGLSEQLWLVVALFLGTVIGIYRLRQSRDIPYSMVFIWAYLGIFVKHAHPLGYNGEYSYGISALVVCIALIISEQIKVIQAPSSTWEKLKEKFD